MSLYSNGISDANHGDPWHIFPSSILDSAKQNKMKGIRGSTTNLNNTVPTNEYG